MEKLGISCKNEDETLKRAKGVLNLLNAGIVDRNLVIDRMNIITGAKLKLIGFNEYDGEYSIKITHSLC